MEQYPVPAPLPTERTKGRSLLDVAVPVALFAAVLAAYVRTMRPTFGWLDTSELLTAVYALGIGHSPGYPTFMLLAHPFTWLPLGSMAWRLNLFSAAAGAVAVVLVYLVGRRLTGNRLAALIGALTLAFGRTMWDLTTELDVHTLNACFIAGVLLCLLRWRQGGHARWLWTAALLWGLGLGNHALLALCGPGFLLLALAAGPRRGRRLAGVVGGVVAGLSVYAYLPLRAAANPPPAVNNPHNLHQLWQLVSGQVYRQYMFSLPLPAVLERLGRFTAHIPAELSLGAPLALLGLVVLWRRDRPLCLALAGTMALVLVYAANYSIFDIYAYLLPVYLLGAVLAAVGAEVALRRGGPLVERLAGAKASLVRPGRGVALVAVLLLCGPAWLFGGSRGSVDVSDDYSAEDFARAALQVAAPDSLIIGDWYSISPLGYLRHVEGLRPDLTLSPAFSAGSPAALRRALDPARLRRFPAVYAVEQQTFKQRGLQQRYPSDPVGPLTRLYVRGRPPAPPAMPARGRPQTVFGGVVALGGVALSPPQPRLGGLATLTLDWQALAPPPGRPLVAMLEVLSAQGDEAARQKWLLAGGAPLPFGGAAQMVRERRLLYLSSDVPAGPYRVLLRLRPLGGRALPAAGGEQTAVIATLDLQPRRP